MSVHAPQESSFRAPKELPVIHAIVRRHAEDAAFYWQLLSSASAATEMAARRASHFTETLALHLEGLELSAGEGRKVALESLQRWRKPGEVFAALHAALVLPPGAEQSEAIQSVFTLIGRSPDTLLRGAISALAWAEPARVYPWMAQALQADAVSRVASLRAFALQGLDVPEWSRHIEHDSPFVRAAACRAAPPSALTTLETLRTDTDLAVRAESILAWMRLVPPHERTAAEATRAASLLWRCVVEQLQWVGQATGWNRMQAQRRLTRWLRYLAWLAPLGHPGVDQLLTQLPTRLALNFVLHHGDLRHVAFVVQAMHQPESARWALWIWRCLTGVDPQVAGLTMPDVPVNLDAPLTAAQQDADHGLPMPDAAAVKAHPANRVNAFGDQRHLMGQPIQPQSLRALLDPEANQPQALRFVAAHALEQLLPHYALNLRASPAVQAVQLNRMGISQ